MVPVCQLSERNETIISTVLPQVVIKIHVAYFDHSIIICSHLIFINFNLFKRPRFAIKVPNHTHVAIPFLI